MGGGGDHKMNVEQKQEVLSTQWAFLTLEEEICPKGSGQNTTEE